MEEQTFFTVNLKMCMRDSNAVVGEDHSPGACIIVEIDTCDAQMARCTVCGFPHTSSHAKGLSAVTGMC